MVDTPNAKSDTLAEGDGTTLRSKKQETELKKRTIKFEMDNIKTLTPLELKPLFHLESTPFPDGNTTPVIGSPLQTSSPLKEPKTTTQPQVDEESSKGAGDAQSMQSLISPIHRSRACHQIHLTGSNSSMGSTAFENLLAEFQRNSSSPGGPVKRPTFQQENVLPDVSKMNEEEAKKLLTKVVKDNMDLRQELRSKEKRISAFKGQMLAILEWKARQEMDAFSEGSSAEDSAEIKSKAKAKKPLNLPKKVSPAKLKKKETITESEESGSSEASNESNETVLTRNSVVQNVALRNNPNTQEVRVVEEVFGMRRSLSFIHELASSIEVDQDLLRHRIRDGCYLTNQLLLGGVSGWLSALFVKKFGKLALSAAGGGLLVLIYTTRKGFVNVNYESIYQEISKLCEGSEDVIGDNTNGAITTTTTNDGNGSCDKTTGNQRSSPSTVTIRGEEDEMNPLNKSKSQLECASSTTWDKIRTARRWLASHTYTVGGFALTFIYNIV